MNTSTQPNERLSFSLEHSCNESQARAGVLTTPQGDVPTPVFMPVGTCGTVKGIDPEVLSALGATICLGNTYHLMLRPGDERVRALGGLHRMMSWDGTILTDSGGYQVFSLAKRRKVSDEGVVFQSHIDGATIELTPERAITIQENLGSNIMMPLDVCAPYPCPEKTVVEAMRRTTDWAKRSLEARKKGALFAIVQGGMDPSLRTEHVGELTQLPTDGYSIGGLSVGEPTELLYELCGHTAKQLPTDRPRYLMGVGTPENLITCIGLGVDMFDCVMPTRHGRNGMAFTWNGDINIKNAMHTDADIPLDTNCSCTTCARFSRAYLRHLFKAREILAHMALTTHNLAFYIELMREARAAILENRFVAFSKHVHSQRQSLSS